MTYSLQTGSMVPSDGDFAGCFTDSISESARCSNLHTAWPACFPFRMRTVVARTGSPADEAKSARFLVHRYQIASSAGVRAESGLLERCVE